MLHAATWPIDMQRDDGRGKDTMHNSDSRQNVTELLLVRPYVPEDYGIARYQPRLGPSQTRRVLTTSLGRQPVQGVVALTIGTDLAAERESRGGREGTAISIDVDDGDLDRSVVLRGNKAVWFS